MGRSKPGPVSRGACPICKAPSEHRVRPFCSERCANIDLLRWLRGGYQIAVRDDDDEDGDREAPRSAATDTAKERDGNENG